MLLFKIKPFADESLASFLFRSAEENLMDKPTWLLSLLAEKWNLKTDENTLNWINGQELEHLSHILGISEKDCNDLTFHSFSTIFLSPIVSGIRCPWIMSRHTKLCPLCLEESERYHRKSWSLTHYIACPHHHILLVDCCYACKRQFKPRQIITGICKCGYHVTNNPKVPVLDVRLIKYQDTICRILQHNSSGLEKALDQPAIFFAAIEWLATWIPQILPEEHIPHLQDIKLTERVIARTRLKKDKKVEQAAVLYVHAYQILQDWPTSFHHLTRVIDVYGIEEKLRTFLKTGLPKLQNTSLHFIYDEFFNYLSTYKLKIDQSFSLITLKEATQIIRYFHESIVNESYFKPLCFMFNNIEITLFSQKEIQNWILQYNQSISKEQLRKIWDTSARATYAILSNNILQGIIHATNGSASKWIVPMKSLHSFHNKIKALSRHEIQETCLSFNRCIEWIGPDFAHYLIEEILNGEIPFKWSAGPLGKAILPKRDVYFAISNKLLLNREETETLSMKNLNFLLGVKRSDIEYWISTGRFGNINSIDSLTIQQYKEFRKNYSTTFQISMETGLTIKQLSKMHQMGKLTSVSGVPHNDGKRLLFNT